MVNTDDDAGASAAPGSWLTFSSEPVLVADFMDAIKSSTSAASPSACSLSVEGVWTVAVFGSMARAVGDVAGEVSGRFGNTSISPTVCIAFTAYSIFAARPLGTPGPVMTTSS
ncbi:hypothetical protein D3C87_1334040 [compost metagenome]